MGRHWIRLNRCFGLYSLSLSLPLPLPSELFCDLPILEHVKRYGNREALQANGTRMVRNSIVFWLWNGYRRHFVGRGYLEVCLSQVHFWFTRNVYNGDPDVPISEVNTLVKYVRQTQQAFMEETDETLISTFSACNHHLWCTRCRDRFPGSSVRHARQREGQIEGGWWSLLSFQKGSRRFASCTRDGTKAQRIRKRVRTTRQTEEAIKGITTQQVRKSQKRLKRFYYDINGQLHN